jgi:hypothetical protein
MMCATVAAGPQETKSDVDPITWHHNDLASEVNGGQNPLPLDLEPEVSYALGSAAFSELEVRLHECSGDCRLSSFGCSQNTGQNKYSS